VSSATPFSEAAGTRHFRDHVHASLLAEMRFGTTLHVSDFAERLLDLTRETAAVRAYASSINDPRLLLRAVEQERSTLVALMARLGIDDASVIATLSEADALATVLVPFLQHQPTEVTRQLADALDELGEHNLAQALNELAERPRLEKEQHRAIA